MKFTNTFNLPQPLVDALTTDTYERGSADYTSTELVTPTRIVSLRRKHDADLVEDVSERAWTLYGQAYHTILERIAKANPSRYVVEQRFETVMPGGVKISGQIDLFDLHTGILSDWKTTSIWKFLLGDFSDWEQQSNVNCYLLRSNGMTVKGLQNISFLKDFKVREARIARLSKGKKEYPQCPIQITNLPMWSVGQAQNFILERAKAHTENMEKPPICTKKERWQRDASFAVMHRDKKRAIKLCDNRDLAEAVMMDAMKKARPGETKKFYIEERGAEPVRCLDFCSVQTYCDFGIAAETKWREKHESEKTEATE